MKYSFKNILSGQYKLVIIKPDFCWKNEEISIKVQNSNIENVNFEQTG